MEESMLKQWKELIQSKVKTAQIDALEEIVEYLNEKNEENYVKFINSDLNYFLSEMLIYQHKASTSLVIKIISHLSEVPVFFKNDFFRYLKSGLRLINSLSSDCVSDIDSEDADYKRNILAFNSIILRRAQKFNADFKDQKIPKVSLTLTASSLTSLNSRIIEKLEFISSVIDVFRSMQVSLDDKIYQEKKMIDILKSLNFSKKDLLDVNYFVLIAKLFHSIIDFLPATNEAEDQILVKLITERFLMVVRFIVLDTNDLPNSTYEIFLNLYYYIFTSIALNDAHTMILNYFLTLNGLNFLIFIANSQDDSASGKMLAFKARVIMSEVMLYFSKFFLEVDDNENLKALREKYLIIMLNCDLNPQNLCFENVRNLTRESLLFVIFKYYVLLKWNKMSKGNAELMSSMAFIIEVFKEKKIAKIDKGIATMLVYVYTANYVNITVKGNKLVENSSENLMKFVGTINIIVDFNFFKWWFIRKWKDRNMKSIYEKLLNYLLSPRSCEKFENLQQEDLFSLDTKFLIQTFLNDKMPIENLQKLTKLLCSVSLNLRDIGKLLTFCEKQKSVQNAQRSINALKILCANLNQMNLRLQKKTCDLASRTLEEKSTNMEERLLAIQLFVNLKNKK